MTDSERVNQGDSLPAAAKEDLQAFKMKEAEFMEHPQNLQRAVTKRPFFKRPVTELLGYQTSIFHNFKFTEHPVNKTSRVC